MSGRVDAIKCYVSPNTEFNNAGAGLPDLHDFVLVLAKQKAKPKLFVLTGQNTIAKQNTKSCRSAVYTRDIVYNEILTK